MENVSINEKQRLYVIPCTEGYAGYTCLGFDVCEKRSVKLAKWLDIENGLGSPHLHKGTIFGYAIYLGLLSLAEQRYKATGQKCDIELTPELIGLEGKMIEVVDAYGEKRQFKVGKSNGWMPCHLELETDKTMDGFHAFGCPAYGAPYVSVRIIKPKKMGVSKKTEAYLHKKIS